MRDEGVAALFANLMTLPAVAHGKIAAILSRGSLVKVVPKDAPPRGYAVSMRAVYRSAAPHRNCRAQSFIE
jgi:hypothetical protein